MLKHEATLLDPSPGEIAERLADATAAANKRCRTRLLADDPAKWRKFARQTQAAAEGFDLWRGGRGGVPGTQLVAAWWTDHIGRKHVVIRGRRVEHDEAKVLLDKAALARRPPLWHCYPQYLYQRFREAHAEWIAVCGCGATGTPEALGWMGETCGPCHDRREEGGDLRGNAAGWLHGVRNPFRAVAFSRDGTKVAALEDHGPISVWDLAAADSPRRLDPPPRSPFAAPQVTVEMTNPLVAFAGEADEFLYVPTGPYEYDRIGAAVYDLRTAGNPLVFTDDDWGPAIEDFVCAACPTASPTRMLSYSSHVLDLRGLDLNRINYHLIRQGFWLSPPCVPAPRHVVLVSTDGVRVVATETLAVVATIPYRPSPRAEHNVYHNHRAAYHEPTRTAFVARGGDVEAYDLDRMVCRQVVAVGRPLGAFSPHVPRVRAMAASADGRHLFVACGDRLVVLEAGTLATLAAFEWHLGPITALAVSPDGRTLATIGVEGVVKLWPIDRLLDSA